MNINCIKEKEFHYETFNHAKTRLRYHFIFSTKYRIKCLNEIRDVVLESFRYAESISHFKIITMEIDKEHIHILVKFPPKYSIEQIVKRMKQISSNYIYNNSASIYEALLLVRKTYNMDTWIFLFYNWRSK